MQEEASLQPSRARCRSTPSSARMSRLEMTSKYAERWASAVTTSVRGATSEASSPPPASRSSTTSFGFSPPAASTSNERSHGTGYLSPRSQPMKFLKTEVFSFSCELAAEPFLF